MKLNFNHFFTRFDLNALAMSRTGQGISEAQALEVAKRWHAPSLFEFQQHAKELATANYCHIEYKQWQAKKAILGTTMFPHAASRSLSILVWCCTNHRWSGGFLEGFIQSCWGQAFSSSADIRRLGSCPVLEVRWNILGDHGYDLNVILKDILIETRQQSCLEKVEIWSGDQHENTLAPNLSWILS